MTISTAHPIAAVLLDVGGIFHLPSHDAVLCALDRAGFTADANHIDAAHYAGTARLQVMPDSDDFIWREYQLAYAERLGVPDEMLEDVIAELSVAFGDGNVWSRVIPGSIDALREIAATGVAIAIVSNHDGRVAGRLLADGICQVGAGPGVDVTVIIDSGVVGVSKPDPAIFHLALDALGVGAHEAIHVGDTHGADVIGAIAAGIRPVQLDPYDLHPNALHERIRTLREVLDLISR